MSERTARAGPGHSVLSWNPLGLLGEAASNMSRLGIEHKIRVIQSNTTVFQRIYVLHRQYADSFISHIPAFRFRKVRRSTLGLPELSAVMALAQGLTLGRSPPSHLRLTKKIQANNVQTLDRS
ncbi:hypothetical protein NQZ68_000401, partial [Dissostichus eleginoides]